MTKATLGKKPRRRTASKRAGRQGSLSGQAKSAAALVFVALIASFAIGQLLDRYTISLQWPLRVHIQMPLVISARTVGDEAAGAQADQAGRRLSAHQQYACRKFGSACRIALAIQRAENQKGACEVYHYNSNGTLDWGYFQINTVHLQRPDVNLRDLLDCKANIDFAYQLYEERGFAPWATYNSGAYRKFLQGSD
ncbi:MAG TPA: hypothetical protein VN442_12520 [Bryobacteraceae bacterium]|nr:hypothetical protein [Bryobacteraceae bacterium]